MTAVAAAAPRRARASSRVPLQSHFTRRSGRTVITRDISGAARLAPRPRAARPGRRRDARSAPPCAIGTLSAATCIHGPRCRRRRGALLYIRLPSRLGREYAEYIMYISRLHIGQFTLHLSSTSIQRMRVVCVSYICIGFYIHTYMYISITICVRIYANPYISIYHVNFYVYDSSISRICSVNMYRV